MAINPNGEGVWNPPVPVALPKPSFCSHRKNDKLAGSLFVIALAGLAIAVGIGTLGVIPIIVGAVVAGAVVAYWGYKLGCWIHDRYFKQPALPPPVEPRVGEPDHAQRLPSGLPPADRAEGH